MLVWLHLVLFLFTLNTVFLKEFDWFKDISTQTHLFTTDQFNNIYVVNNNQLTKFSISENSALNYSNNLNGRIHSIDATDPFRIMLFYKDFNKIIILDNKLSEMRSAILLNDLEYYNIQAVCSSTRGGFWIFDMDLLQLIYFDKTLKLNQKSSSLNNLFENIGSKEKAIMIEKNELVYLGFPGEGIFQFDIYGTFIKKFPITDFLNFQVIESKIIYFSEKKLNVYDTFNFELEQLTIPNEEAKECRIEGSRLFLILSDRISIYNMRN